MAKANDSKKQGNPQWRMNEADKRETVARVKAGEPYRAIAADLGFTRTTVGNVYARYLDIGEEAFKDQRLGRKKLSGTFAGHESWLRGRLTQYSPEDEGVSGGGSDAGSWSGKQVQELLRREKGEKVTINKCLDFLRSIGLRPVFHGGSER